MTAYPWVSRALTMPCARCKADVACDLVHARLECSKCGCCAELPAAIARVALASLLRARAAETGDSSQFAIRVRAFVSPIAPLLGGLFVIVSLGMGAVLQFPIHAHLAGRDPMYRGFVGAIVAIGVWALLLWGASCVVSAWKRAGVGRAVERRRCRRCATSAVFATGEDESCASCPGCGALLPAESSAAQAGPIPVSATALPTAHTMLGFQLKFVLFTLGLVIVIACVMQLRR